MFLLRACWSRKDSMVHRPWAKWFEVINACKKIPPQFIKFASLYSSAFLTVGALLCYIHWSGGRNTLRAPLLRKGILSTEKAHRGGYQSRHFSFSRTLKKKITPIFFFHVLSGQWLCNIYYTVVLMNLRNNAVYKIVGKSFIRTDIFLPFTLALAVDMLLLTLYWHS